MPRDKAGFRRFFAYVEEANLTEPLRAICHRHGSSLLEIYLDTRTPAAVAARIEVWWWLITETWRSPNEVATLFARDHASITHAIRQLRERAAALDVRVAPDTAPTLAKLIAVDFSRRRAIKRA